MSDDSKNAAAVELGKLGGLKTAERGPGFYSAIQAQRKEKRGGRPRNPIKATHEGELKIGDALIPCAVLEDGTRVISQRGFARAVGASTPTAISRRGAGELPVLLTARNLRAFISADLAESAKPIEYIAVRGGRSAYGIAASAIPKICEVWLKARDAGELKHNQLHLAGAADILIRGLAGVAMTALVDEATGYQVIRDKHALQAILDAYLRKELAAWAKRFPDEFYQQMFRLRGWEWKGMKINRPSVVGIYTKDLVYERLAPNILEELETRNPKDSRGRRTAKHHMWLTDDIGVPALAQHLWALIGLMRVCANGEWDRFYNMVEKAFPKKGETLLLPFPESELVPR
jgi:hypothetical protein